MAIAPPTPDLLDTLHESCRRAGLDARGARLIHHYANAVFHLPAEDAVARVTRRDSHPYAVTTHRLCGWLVGVHGYPATRPLPGVPAVTVDQNTVTFWAYYPQPTPTPAVTSADLGRLLRRLHDLPDPPDLSAPNTPSGPNAPDGVDGVDAPGRLPTWTPLTSLEATVRAVGGDVLSDADRDWLLTEITATRGRLAALDWPLGHGLIHGDAWAGNLLWDTTPSATGATADAGRDAGPVGRWLLGDWDGLSYGPREVDLIPTWHAATRYGRGPAWAASFAAAYGYDLAGWSGYPTLSRMRDLVQLTGPLRRARPGTVFDTALRQRLTGIRAHDTATWTAL